MLIWLVELSEHLKFLNLFRYITFRTGASLFTSALIVFLFGPMIINNRCACARARVSRSAPTGRRRIFKKAGTPTMGGLMILAGIVGSSLLWANLSQRLCRGVLLVTLGFGAIGFYDDYLKVTKQSHKGFSGKARLGIEFIIAGIAVYFMMRAASSSAAAGSTFGSSVPFRSSRTSCQSRHGSSCVRWFRHRRRRQCREPDRRSRRSRDRACHDRAASFGMIAYLAGNAVFANYLQINFVPGPGELAVVLRRGDRRGARLPLVQRAAGRDLHGRHRFAGARRHARHHRRRHQARDRAGDHRRPVRDGNAVGHHPGRLFKLTGKRVFLMAPIHHHFEKKGWTESQVVIRFWIIAVDAGAGRPLDAEAAVRRS
jgi:phospho-N-acetylmuramoyl-pentapeptide-transferase